MRKIRPTEFQQLIFDYYKDNEYIRRQKIHWITLKEKPMGKLPNNSDMEEIESDEKERPAKKIMRAVTNYVLKPKKKSKLVKTKGERQEPGAKASKASAKAK